jgi:hypothetical protein
MTDHARALLGTWRMTLWTRTLVATGAVSHAMGPDPVGYIAYHADGRMMALVLRRDRAAPAGPAPTKAEKVALFDSMLAYTAGYTVEHGRVVHQVDAAWNPAWLGALVRPFKLIGDRLVISGAPSKDPATGEDVLYRIEFARVRAG